MTNKEINQRLVENILWMTTNPSKHRDMRDIQDIAAIIILQANKYNLIDDDVYKNKKKVGILKNVSYDNNGVKLTVIFDDRAANFNVEFE